MEIHIVRILVAMLLAAVLWWVTMVLSPPAPIGKIVRVLIVIVFVLWLLADMGLIGSKLKIS